MEYGEVLSRFRGLKPHPSKNGYWWFYCPIHKGGQEKNRSGAAWIGKDGRLLLGCWACHAEWRAIAEAVGLMARDLFPEDLAREDRPKRWEGPMKRKVVERYDYQAEDGAVLYRVLRYEPKGFSIERYDATDGLFHAGIADVRRVLYKLPEIVSRASEPVFVVEGERKALALAKWGLLATAMAGGTGMGWRDEYSRSLTDRKVIVIPDMDKPGIEHAYTVCGSLMAHDAASVRLVVLTDLGEIRDHSGLDVLDWMELGRDLNDLRRVALASVEWRPRS